MALGLVDHPRYAARRGRSVHQQPFDDAGLCCFDHTPGQRSAQRRHDSRLCFDNGTTRIGEAVQGKIQLDQAGARILGVVMNKIPTGRRGYSYYYYHHRYYDYDGDGKRRRSRRDSRPAAPALAAPMADAIMPREAQLNPSQK